MVMKQLSEIMRENHVSMVTHTPNFFLQNTKGPDWNPRTLSSFSTFGGRNVIGSPHAGIKDESQSNYNEINNHSPPLVNGEVFHLKNETPLANGQATKISKKTKVTPYKGFEPPPPRSSPTSMSSRSSCSSSSTSGVSSVQEVALNRPDLLLQFYNNSQYKEPTEDTSQIKIKGTKVPPPIIPKHAYSKSLIGEETPTALVPNHSHSRSIGEEQLGELNTTKFKNGIGEVCLFIGPNNRRFGFSVVGGSDEKFPPRIDEIAKGSPADKADLEVGDEILEVNGKSLEDATHTEVISHIHQCIRSRTICLRVKRRTGNKLAADLAASSNVQDAFVIAVEQRARERLERLSALKKIKPVDMTKLSSQLSDTVPNRSESPAEAASEDVNGVLEASPIYVTSVPNLTSSSAPVKRSSSRTQSRSSTPGRGSSASPRHRPKSPFATPPRDSSSTVPSSSSSSGGKKRATGGGTTSLPSQALEGDADGGNKSGDELELTHDLDNDEEDNAVCTTGDSRSEDDLEDEVSESGESLPATPEKTYGLAAHPTREARREVLLDSKSHAIVDRPRSPLEYTTSLESKDSSSSRKSGGSGSSSAGTGSSKPLTSSKGSSGYQDRGGGYRTSVDAGDPQESMISMVEFNPANKEMAVDVPDTFVGRTKTPPRYPPPKPQGSSGYISSSIPYNNNNNNSSSSKGSSKRGTSLSSGTVTPVNGTLSKPVSPPVVPELHQRQDVLVHSPNTQEEVIKLKKYEEEYKQRKEREEEVAELQRNSIRGSQKLQALASYPEGTPQPTHSGVVNEAYDQENHEGDDRNSSSPSINELIQSLQRIQNVLKSNGHRISEDMTLVAQLLVNPEFQKVLAVHNKVQETWCLNRPPTPVTFKAQELVAECLEALNESSSSEALELVQLLSKYPMEGLFYAHDRIADSEPPLENVGTEHSVDAVPEDVVERQSNYLEDNVKIVRIDKTNEPLGATIRNEGSSVIIGRIVRGGAAEKSGRLHEGDEILEVNGIEVRGKSVNDVCDMLAGMTGTLTFIIIPCPSLLTVTPTPPVHNTIHVKAYFDYDPEEDLYIPCRELGMSFQKGDILHVMNQQDPNWWQAYRDGEEDQSLAGLIPSKSFQQQREAMRQTVVGDSNNKEKSKKGKLLCAKKNQKKKKKKMLYPNYNDVRYQSHLPLSGNGEEIPRIVDDATDDGLGAGRSRVLKIHLPSLRCCKHSSSSSSRHYSRRNSTVDDYDTEEILTYEEVALYFPRSNRKRPIVLIGPPNIGRHELRQKLMEDTEKFAAAVPHTSRPKKDAEVDGQDYHFISRTQFEADILSRKFVEHGEYEKAYYGTSLDAIRSVVNSGKICVLNLHPLSLKMLKNSDLMPYVVLIAPPSLEKLRQKKQKSGETVWEEELKETIQKAREMEDQYGHYFDLVLINQDVERTYQQLIHEINVLEREPQWVPAAWLTSQ